MTKLAFDHCSTDYAAGRPGYPDAVVEILRQGCLPGRGSTVADIGAGTGIFTRKLASCGWKVLAVEPSEKMIGHVLAGEPAAPPQFIHRVCAVAEATGLRRASVDMITCAQSFHWFNPPVVLAEFARVVRPGGVLALVWNNRDADDAFVADFESLVAKWNPAYQREYRQQDWAGKVAASGNFSPLIRQTVRWTWRLMQQEFVGFTRSVSYIRNVLAREGQAPFESDLRGLLRAHFADQGCEIPMYTDVWTCARRSD